jgi:hypothetical protein
VLGTGAHGTVSRVQQSDPVDVAVQLVRERFPEAHAAFLGGSVLTSRRTPTSDLDIVVVLSGPPAPFRETLRHSGWVVELFVQTPTSLRHYWRRDVAARRTPLLRMCAEGRVLLSDGGAAERYADEALAVLEGGPEPLPADMLDLKRYLLTDLLDDLRGCADEVELAYLAAGLVTAASEFVLLAGNRWSAGGKWLPRRLAEIDPGLAGRLVVAQRAALNGNSDLLEAAVLDVLQRAGGPLTEGFHLAGEDPG